MNKLFHRIEGLISTLFHVILLTSTTHPSLIHTAGIGDTLNEINETIKGISLFIKTIYSITSAVGFTTIMFFIAVLLFSSGISSLGIPRGAASLILSLILIDGIWVIWNMSMVGNIIISQKMVYSNAIITVPLILYYIIRILIPAIIRKFKDRRIKINEEPEIILNTITLLSNKVQASLIKDKNTTLSLESKEAILALKIFIDSLDKSTPPKTTE
jgi:hypothetical protein